MNQKCVNSGGESTLICAEQPLKLEQQFNLAATAIAATKLWQVRCGEIITVRDSKHNWFRARIAQLDEQLLTIVPFESLPQPDSALEICVFQALPDKERFELVLQKLTEIGVSHIVPFVSKHSSTLQQRDAGQKKSHRWPDVVLRAARQCRRAMVPQLFAVHTWDEVLEQLDAWDTKLILDARVGTWSMCEGVGSGQPNRVAIIVGPEGGFATDEIAQAQGCGAVPVTIGPRILRTETAAIVAAALVQHLAGDYA
jgi:16S rRNA (uracil1498-N3)-methyltransferase